MELELELEVEVEVELELELELELKEMAGVKEVAEGATTLLLVQKPLGSPCILI